MQVLERIEQGEISPEEGARLLSEMVDQSEEASSHGQTASEDEATPTPPLQEEIERWRRWWRIPLWVGFGVTILSGTFLFRALEAGVFWFACALIPFFLGVGFIALSWRSRTARWLHLRIRQRSGERPTFIALSMPLPLGLVANVFRWLLLFMPQTSVLYADDVLHAFDQVVPRGESIYINVTGEDNETVQIFFG